MGMMIKKKYGLQFEKITDKEFDYISYSCSPTPSIPGSGFLALLLDMVSDEEPEFLLEEIDAALNEKEFEEYYFPNNAQGNNGVHISPPNAIIKEAFALPLTELKILLEEWIDFINA